MSTVIDHTDYREILREEFARRCKQNPRYSQGAFARDIQLRPSRLSEILRGKQGLSAKAAQDVSRGLGFSEVESNYFTDLVLSEHGRSQTTRETARIRLSRYQNRSRYTQLQEDSFRVIADWHHLAIVELTKVDGFKSDAKWIASALAITPAETQLAIDRLIRLDLLSERSGRLVATSRNNLVCSDIPSASIRTFHGQILEKAQEALLTQSLAKRSNHSYIVAVDRSKLPEFRRRLLDFAREIDQEMEASAERNAVYCLSTQLFELTLPQN